MRHLSLVLLFLALCGSLTPAAAVPSVVDPEKDPQMTELLQEASHSINTKQMTKAIKQCDKVIGSFESYYKDRKKNIYCGQGPAEALYYATNAIMNRDGKIPVPPQMENTLKHDRTIVLFSTWASAYYLKGCALQGLGRYADAKPVLLRAVGLSPANSQFLSELGGIYQFQKNWSKAMEQFAAAEEHVPLMTESADADELGRARRGQGYVFVELGKLDEAEAQYQQCLKDNPGDTRAKAELGYVRSLRAKGAAH